MPKSPRLEFHVLVWRRPRVIRDEAEPRFRDVRTDSLQESELPDRQEHRLVVNQLLDAMEHCLALLRIELARLLSEQAVDVGVAAVGERATRDHERLQPGGGVSEDAGEPEDDVLQLLLLVRLHEPRALERSKAHLDADGLQIVEN